MMRASRAHYLVIYKVLHEVEKVVVVAILKASVDPDRPIKPFVWRERKEKPKSKSQMWKEANAREMERRRLKMEMKRESENEG